MVSQCTLPANRQLVPGDRFAIHELFPRFDVSSVLEFAELSTEVAVGFIEQVPEATEGDFSVPRQEYRGRHARSVLQKRIQFGQDVPPPLQHAASAGSHAGETDASRR